MDPSSFIDKEGVKHASNDTLLSWGTARPPASCTAILVPSEEQLWSLFWNKAMNGPRAY